MIAGNYYIQMNIKPVKGTFGKLAHIARFSSDAVANLDPEKRYSLVVEDDVIRVVEATKGGAKPLHIELHNKGRARFATITLVIHSQKVVKPICDKFGTNVRIYGEIRDIDSGEVVYPLANIERPIRRR